MTRFVISVRENGRALTMKKAQPNQKKVRKAQDDDFAVLQKKDESLNDLFERTRRIARKSGIMCVVGLDDFACCNGSKK